MDRGGGLRLLLWSDKNNSLTNERRQFRLSKSIERNTEQMMTYKSSDTIDMATRSTKLSEVSFVTRVSTNFHERPSLEKKEDIAEANDFIKAHTGKTVMVFSGGSVCDGSVGCGACATVLIPLGENVYYRE